MFPRIRQHGWDVDLTRAGTPLNVRRSWMQDILLHQLQHRPMRRRSPFVCHCIYEMSFSLFRIGCSSWIYFFRFSKYLSFLFRHGPLLHPQSLSLTLNELLGRHTFVNRIQRFLSDRQTELLEMFIHMNVQQVVRNTI